jgi:glycosyltransferase involved in cell wall biosynthesis
MFEVNGDIDSSRLKESLLIIDDYKDYKTFFEIVIPTFKRPELLIDAVESALNQNYSEDYKVTVIDNDPSSENYNEINLARFDGKIKYYKNKENLGIENNWNKTLILSNSNWVCLLADDDMLHPDYLKTVKSVIDKKDPGIIVNLPKIIDGSGNVNYYYNYGKSVFLKKIHFLFIRNSIHKVRWRAYLLGNATSACAMAINREKGIFLKGWALSEYPSGDYFFNSRMAYNFTVFRINKAISFYRLGYNESLKKDTQKQFLIRDLNFLILNYLNISKMEKLIFSLPIRYQITKKFLSINLDGNSNLMETSIYTFDEIDNFLIFNKPVYFLGMILSYVYKLVLIS